MKYLLMQTVTSAKHWYITIALSFIIGTGVNLAYALDESPAECIRVCGDDLGNCMQENLRLYASRYLQGCIGYYDDPEYCRSSFLNGLQKTGLACREIFEDCTYLCQAGDDI